MSEKSIFKVGSRKSQLALIQTKVVIDNLQKLYKDKNFEIVEMTTVGDTILDKPLPKIGEKSLFTKELEEALLKGSVDFIVHSLKDLPTVLPDGLIIGAVLEREDPRDAVILHSKYENENLKNLPEGSVIGTSSLRRTAQLSRNYPNVQVKSIRGNLNTRMNKLNANDTYAGIILAAAGVKRMKWEEKITEYLDPSEFLYAVGQGAIAVECRIDDDSVLDLLESLNHAPTILRVIAERSFLKTLGGGCSAPVAVHSMFSNNSLSITGAVWSLDGEKFIEKSATSVLDFDDVQPPRKSRNIEKRPCAGIYAKNVEIMKLISAENLGKELADDMIKYGALNIIEEAKTMNEKVDGSVIVKNSRTNGNNVKLNDDKSQS